MNGMFKGTGNGVPLRTLTLPHALARLANEGATCGPLPTPDFEPGCHDARRGAHDFTSKAAVVHKAISCMTGDAVNVAKVTGRWMQ